ncbi:MAG: hypothetical protein K0Q50_2409 [Vampirovibrio sp.]|jgi:uncharacterized protein (DUF58 family)|nr:hypothetical protein [Vampirovibrio sp.]
MQALLRWLDPLLNPLACLPPAPDASYRPENADALLKRLEAMLQHQLRYALSGEQRSILRGQGLDFADLREYMPGDDIRKIDWSVFARTLTPHVREYHEEKQLTLWLTVDLTPSMRFGRQKSKLRHALDLTGLLGLLAQKGNHKLGAMLITGNDTRIIPPKTGYVHLQHITKTLLDTANQPISGPLPNDPLPDACQKLAHLAQKNSTVLFLSDFLSTSTQWKSPLGQLSRQTKLVYLVLQDSVEAQVPADIGLLSVTDPETGQISAIDTNNPSFRHAYGQQARQQMQQTLQILTQTGKAAMAPTDQDPISIVAALVQEGQATR